MRFHGVSIALAIGCRISAAFSTLPTFRGELKTLPVVSNLKIALEPPNDAQDLSMIRPELSTHDLPWTTFQDWALRDNLSNYVVIIPRKGSKDPELYALWRTMGREVVELSGYPIEMLQQMHARQLQKGETSSDLRLSTTPASLPLLDDYKFEMFGGLSGKVYGIVGLLDGTRVETSQVKDVQVTLPKGYVETHDGSVAYELGMPCTDRAGYSLGISSGDSKIVVSQLPTDTEFLVKLGASTGILLAGATAVNMLSHHLTVNVFWV